MTCTEGGATMPLSGRQADRPQLEFVDVSGDVVDHTGRFGLEHPLMAPAQLGLPVHRRASAMSSPAPAEVVA